LSVEANRVFPSIERELEEPFLTSKKKRVLVMVAKREGNGWHFRIPAKTYEVWTLICVDLDGNRLNDFVIPQKYYSPKFSQATKRSTDGLIHVRLSNYHDKWNLEFVDLLAIGLNFVQSDPIDITDLQSKDQTPDLIEISNLLRNYEPLR